MLHCMNSEMQTAMKREKRRKTIFDVTFYRLRTAIVCAVKITSLWGGA